MFIKYACHLFVLPGFLFCFVCLLKKKLFIYNLMAGKKILLSFLFSSIRPGVAILGPGIVFRLQRILGCLNIVIGFHSHHPQGQ